MFDYARIGRRLQEWDRPLIAVAFVAIIAGIGALGFCGVWDSDTAVGEGVYDRAEHQRATFGAGPLTVIHWQDGRTTVLRRLVSIPMTRGKRYRVWKHDGMYIAFRFERMGK